MSWPTYPNYMISGFEWIGYIPSNWRIVRFKYLFDEVDERNGDNPVGVMLSVSGYRGVEEKVYEDDSKKRSKDELRDYRVVRPGWLAVNTMWLNYAGLGISSLTGHMSPAYRAYIPKQAIHPQYAHHLLRSSVYVSGYTKYLQGIRPNSLQIKTEDFESFPVLLPAPEEQNQIAQFLDHETARIDALIEEQKRLIDLLQEKRQAVISQAVTKGLEPDVPMKDSGVEWLGEVPEHWAVVPLKYAGRLITGITPPSEDLENYGEEGWPWIRPDDLDESGVPLKASKFVTEKGWDYCRRVNPDSTLVCCIGSIGKVGYVDQEVATNQQITAICSKERNRFLFYCIIAAKPEIDRNATGNVLRIINADRLGDIKVVIPTVSEANQIAKVIDEKAHEIDALIKEVEQGSALLRERHAALISAAVTGKIDVRNWNPQNASVEYVLFQVVETE